MNAVIRQRAMTMARLRYSREEAQAEAVRWAKAFIAEWPDGGQWRFLRAFPNSLAPTSETSKHPVAWFVLFAPVPPEDGVVDGGELWVAVDLESGSVGLHGGL